MGTEDAATIERPPFGTIFHAMPEQFCVEVVRIALQHRRQASTGARDRLNGRLRRLKVPGFRDGSRAKPAQLELPVLDRILDGDDRLAGAVLRCWEEGNVGLREAVAAYLADEHIEVCTERRPDHFAATWPEAEWKTHRRKVLEANSDLSFDAVGLMLILQVGKHPAPNLDDVPQVVSPRFRRWLDELEALPATAPEWGDAEDFAETVTWFAEIKSTELLYAVLQRKKAAVEAVVDGYADELDYLGVDTAPLAEPAGRDPLAVAVVAEDLAKALAAYRPVRPQADSRDGEEKRAVLRSRCEEAVLKLVADWEALPKDVFVPAPGADDDTPPPVDAGRLTEELGETKAELARLTAGHAKLREEHEQASEANRGLRLSREQLTGELSELRAELDQRRQAEERWRLAYVEARKSRSAQGDALPEVATVKDAVDLAEHAFGDELVVALNGKSDLGIPFGKPAEVFDALALARNLLSSTGLAIHCRSLSRLVPQVPQARPDRHHHGPFSAMVRDLVRRTKLRGVEPHRQGSLVRPEEHHSNRFRLGRRTRTGGRGLRRSPSTHAMTLVPTGQSRRLSPRCPGWSGWRSCTTRGETRR